MHDKLKDIIKKILEKTSKTGFRLVDEKNIAYGIQLVFEKNERIIKMNVYYSEKKGYSFVFPSSKDSSEKRALESLVTYLKIKDKTEEHNFSVWLGTDESGKGDFFGALSAAGFVADKKIAMILKEKGVTDSKTLSDTQVEKITKFLYANFGNRIESLVLMPEKYNELYRKFSLQKKKLNHLLAWMHGRIILNLYKKHPFDSAIVDKFVDKKVIVSSLKDLKNIKIITRTKAESDPAVAAASIIARYHFVQSIKMLERKYKMTFPKGASQKVIEAGKNFVELYGKERLKEVAKIHFKTYNNL
jgi:ribonuclease HIII